LGFGNPVIKKAIEDALETGILSGYETKYSAQLGETLTRILPSAEMVRFANSGTEGTILTLRLARAYTGKKKVVKFWGHFHGLHDYILYNAHSPLTPIEPGGYVPLSQESAGIPTEMDDLILVIPWKDEEAIEKAVKEEGDQIAAIIMEPINYNSGCIIPDNNYLEFVRKLASRNNIVLIYDEVLSAFRTGPSCAQGYFGVTPDLTVISKALGNGVPIAIVAGKREIMSRLAPFGDVAHSGTYTGNLLSVMVAQACLDEITKDGFYDHIFAIADQLYSGLREVFDRAGIPARVQGLGARFGIYFGFTDEVKTFSDALKHDTNLAANFMRACAGRGVYFHNYGNMALGHHGFSSSHTAMDIEESLNRIETALKDMIKEGI
jgi:glutamate-1-semialdehyde 2,1-aminomutase